jgi:hypothetical protein
MFWLASKSSLRLVKAKSEAKSEAGEDDEAERDADVDANGAVGPRLRADVAEWGADRPVDESSSMAICSLELVDKNKGFLTEHLYILEPKGDYFFL